MPFTSRQHEGDNLEMNLVNKSHQFDDFAQSYDADMKNALGKTYISDPKFFHFCKADIIERWFADDKIPHAILDFGCGIGGLSRILAERFKSSQIDGYDLSEMCINIASAETADIKNLRFLNKMKKNIRYKLIVVANVFHHVKKDQREQTLHLILNKMEHDGKIVVFEHNPFNLLTRHAVARCAFDINAKLISMRKMISLAKACGLIVDKRSYILFFPWRGKYWRIFEIMLMWLPLGAQYAVCLKARRD